MSKTFQDEAQQQRYAETISAQFTSGRMTREALADELAGGFITTAQYVAILSGGYDVGATARFSADQSSERAERTVGQ